MRAFCVCHLIFGFVVDTCYRITKRTRRFTKGRVLRLQYFIFISCFGIITITTGKVRAMFSLNLNAVVYCRAKRRTRSLSAARRKRSQKATMRRKWMPPQSAARRPSLVHRIGLERRSASKSFKHVIRYSVKNCQTFGQLQDSLKI